MGNNQSNAMNKFAEVVRNIKSWTSTDTNALAVLNDEDCAICALASKEIYGGKERLSQSMRLALQEKGYEVLRENYFDGKLRADDDVESYQPMATFIYMPINGGPSNMLIAFRGSVTANDWSTNSDAAPIISRLWLEELSNVKVHAGWDGAVWNRYAQTVLGYDLEKGQPKASELLEAFEVEKILFAGHSLGGALAQIASLAAMVKLPQLLSKCEMVPEVRTFVFAAPMPFYFDEKKLSEKEKDVLANYGNSSYNLVFDMDVVPRIPGHHKWIASSIDDFRKMGKKRIPFIVPSLIINKYITPFMNKIAEGAVKNLRTFEKYKHVSKLLVFNLNSANSIDEFTSFKVQLYSPENFANLPYPFGPGKNDSFFKPLLGLPAHSCLPETLARNSFPALRLSLSSSFVSGTEEVCKLLTEMKEDKKSPEAQRYAIEHLNALAANDADSGADIAHAGGIPQILEAMKIHEDSRELQEHACMTLSHLAANSTDNQDAIVKAGGIPQIIKAVRNHETSEKVLKHAWMAVCNLAANNNDNKVAIVEAGGIQQICEIMKNHKMSEEVQKHGCRMLRDLTDLGNKVVIDKRDAIPQILEAMNNHEKSKVVQEEACKLLCNLSSSKCALEAMIEQKLDTEQLLVKAVNNYSTCEESAKVVIQNLRPMKVIATLQGCAS